MPSQEDKRRELLETTLTIADENGEAKLVTVGDLISEAGYMLVLEREGMDNVTFAKHIREAEQQRCAETVRGMDVPPWLKPFLETAATAIKAGDE